MSDIVLKGMYIKGDEIDAIDARDNRTIKIYMHNGQCMDIPKTELAKKQVREFIEEKESEND